MSFLIYRDADVSSTPPELTVEKLLHHADRREAFDDANVRQCVRDETETPWNKGSCERRRLQEQLA